MADLAVLGAGRMGGALARRLAGAGHAVTIWNRTAAAAQAVADAVPNGRVTVAAAPADAVRHRSVVLSMLTDGDATRSVLLDSSVLAALDPATVVCDMGTSGVPAARALAAGVRAAGARFVDAPVSGSVPAAASGTLLVMAGGDPGAIDAARVALKDVASEVIRVGEVGAGQAMKLAVNLVVHDLNAALAEALMLAEWSGVSRADAYDVFERSVVAAPFLQYKRAAFLDPGTPVAMSLDLAAKDLRLITDSARDLGIPATVTEAARDAVAAACAAGLGRSDMAALSRVAIARTVGTDATLS